MKTYQTIILLIACISFMSFIQYMYVEYIVRQLTYDPIGNDVIYKACFYIFIPILTIGIGAFLTLILYCLERYFCNEQEERTRLLNRV